MNKIGINEKLLINLMKKFDIQKNDDCEFFVIFFFIITRIQGQIFLIVLFFCVCVFDDSLKGIS